MNKTTRLKKPQIPELDTLYKFDDLGGRPKYGGVEMTSETDIPSFQEIMDETHSAVVAEATARDDADEELESEIQELAGQTSEAIETVTEAINAEASTRGAADNVLQEQIDALVASSDVKDIVGTKAELDAYDTSTLGDNDIIKVLQDETQEDATTYYRYVQASDSFTLIGSEGPYYTKAQSDAALNLKADKATTYTKTEVDAALGTKQDTLTAGENITIDNGVISADGLVTLSYGHSTWQDFINAYNSGKIVYCRASSNDDPSLNAQSRLAFMAYVNNPTNPTGVEFQYVRSVSNKTAAQQMDQVFVYKLTSANGGTWTVETRNMASKVVAGNGLSSTYSNGILTLASVSQGVEQLGDNVQLWTLSPGMYITGSNNKVAVNRNIDRGEVVIVGGHQIGQTVIPIIRLSAMLYSPAGSYTSAYYVVDSSNGALREDISRTLGGPVNHLTMEYTGWALDAHQGKVLKDLIDAIDAPATINSQDWEALWQ